MENARWSLVLVCSLSALTWGYYGGDGSYQNPYQIASAEDLIQLGQSPRDYDRHFRLVADIDLSGYKFDRAVIAPSDKPLVFEGGFAGTFRGNGHMIRNLHITGDTMLGLFGNLTETAMVHGLGIVDAHIAAAGRRAGMLAAFSDGAVDRCFCEGTVSGQREVGAFVGWNQGTIIDSYALGAVHAVERLGGFVGTPDIRNLIRCYCACAFTTDAEDFELWVFGPERGDGLPINSFWNAEISGITGEGGLETSTMMKAETFIAAGWDFLGETANGLYETWTMPIEGGYPVLSLFQGIVSPWPHDDGLSLGFCTLSEDPNLVLWQAPEVFDAAWHSVSVTRATPNPDRYSQIGISEPSDVIKISGEVEILDRTDLIGIDLDYSLACQAFDGEGNSVRLDNVAGSFEPSHKWITLPSGRKALTCSLHLENGQPIPHTLSEVDVLVHALYAQPLMELYVPFMVSEEWAEVIPGFKVKINRALSEDGKCEFEIEVEHTLGGHATGFLKENFDTALEDGRRLQLQLDKVDVLIEMDFTDSEGQPTTHNGGRTSTSSSSKEGVSKKAYTGDWYECSGIEKVRFTLALNPHVKIVPLTLYDVVISEN